MPTVEAHILEGYTADEKRRLKQALTDAIRFVVPAQGDAIVTLIHEYPAENYARGGIERQPAPALPDPSKLVLDYLGAMEAREIDRAEAMLGDGFAMVFPGTGPMANLTELIDWAKGRYRFVTKTYEAVEAFQNGDAAVVYTRGTLAGEWPEGTPFAGIRFIDRFEVKGGKITKQDVWNDIAEVRAQ